MARHSDSCASLGHGADDTTWATDSWHHCRPASQPPASKAAITALVRRPPTLHSNLIDWLSCWSFHELGCLYLLDLDDRIYLSPRSRSTLRYNRIFGHRGGGSPWRKPQPDSD